MAQWNPELYLRFEDERTRPAAELLARVPLHSAAYVVDLGCGPGNSTALLAQRYPQARITGVDTSEAMLASARQRLPSACFVQADMAHWAPEQAPDLIYANAALQWVSDHDQLLPRLFDQLAPGGVLAIQMPDNLQEPTHRLMRELALQPQWRDVLSNAARQRTPLPPVQHHYDLLAPQAAQLDIWHTVYQHPMASAAAIVEWLRATGLRPFLEPLSQAQQAEFLAAYQDLVDAAYPARRDGRRLLAFPRLFIVAQRHP